MRANTLFLRLEGPLQSWGDQGSKFVIRRTAEAPTKSGVVGLLCAALGVSRADARRRLVELNALRLGVRIDRPGVRWWDYQTVGAGMQMRIAEAEGKTKPGAMLTRREYLCDASFLVAIHGDPTLIDSLHAALLDPTWPPYLGRKSCAASVPLLGRNDEPGTGEFADLESAIRSVPWRKRAREDPVPDVVDCLLEWSAALPGDSVPPEAEVWYDVAQSFDVPGHQARLVIRRQLTVGDGKDIGLGTPRQNHTPPPPRPRADYANTEYRRKRQTRLDADRGLCVFCKSAGTTVQHITYRRAGGGESVDDLRSLCRLCHDAVTMIEYGLGMDLDRINPEEAKWRDRIIAKRDEMIRFRSLETRRRRLNAEEVE
ncbi:MAG: type I-E CRISPR-associated protein Cas5/CasD [Phycisphaerae bacterium]|nr:type I-E CRISPR-associated protein Cas5/CasD [Phycisphaerae bacterium]